MPIHYVRAALPPCPDELPPDLRAHVAELAAAWARHSLRPVPPADVVAQWDATIEAWTRTSDLPLFVRKTRDNRGHALMHPSGRVLIPVDNSPAQWIYALACRSIAYTLEEVRALLARDEIPVAMIFKRDERAGARLRRRLGSNGTADAGWKLGHIASVGLRSAGVPTSMPIAHLELHHRRLLSPSNMFLVPLAWAGLAELPEVTASMAQAVGR